MNDPPIFRRVFYFFVISFPVIVSTSLTTHDVVVIIISQGNSYNEKLGGSLRNNILQQCSQYGLEPPIVKTVPQDYSFPGAWTLIPLLPRIHADFADSKKWIVFIEDTSQVNVTRLFETLGDLNKDTAWAGYALRDAEPTIIHHYKPAAAYHFPLIPAGFVISTPSLIPFSENVVLSDFVIDPAYELAVYLNHTLSHLPSTFCASFETGCAIGPGVQHSCDSSLSSIDVFFAVKTFSEYHETRLPIIQKTWALVAPSLKYFSDVSDPEIPTISVGLPNTVRGHCAKTLRALTLALTLSPSAKWFVLVDDDTLISVPRLIDLLACYPEDLVVGERYGFGVRAVSVYGYPTGGAGVAFGYKLLPRLLATCKCPSPDAPDDMVIGACLSSMEAKLVHSPAFHQARPNDYPAQLLHSYPPISFHKFWQIDPLAVYQEWFGFLDSNKSVSSHHEEL